MNKLHPSPAPPQYKSSTSVRSPRLNTGDQQTISITGDTCPRFSQKLNDGQSASSTPPFSSTRPMSIILCSEAAPMILPPLFFPSFYQPVQDTAIRSKIPHTMVSKARFPVSSSSFKNHRPHCLQLNLPYKCSSLLLWSILNRLALVQEQDLLWAQSPSTHFISQNPTRGTAHTLSRENPHHYPALPDCFSLSSA